MAEGLFVMADALAYDACLGNTPVTHAAYGFVPIREIAATKSLPCG